MRRVLAALALLFAFPSWAAIVYEGAGTPVEDNGATISVAVPLYTGHASGDAMFVYVGFSGDNNGETTFDVSGFTLIESEQSSNASNLVLSQLWCKIHDGSESDPTFSVASTDTGDVGVAFSFGFSGTVSSCASIVAHTNEIDTTATANITTPSLTNSTANVALLVCGTKATGTATPGVATLDTDGLAWAEIAEKDTVSGDDVVGVCDYFIDDSTPTSLSTDSFVLDTPNSATARTAAIALAIASASPPSFTAGPTLGDPDITSLPVTFTTDQDATVEGVACADGAAAPDATEIKADQCDGGGAAPAHFDESTLAGISDGATFTGLTAATTYDLHFVATDADGDSAVSSIANATTDSAGAPTITDVDTDETVTATQTNVVITGTDFGAAQGAGSVTLRQSGNTKTLSVDSWSATSIQVDMSGVGMGVVDGLLYGSADIRVTTDSAAFDDQAITLAVPSGTAYANLTGLVTLAYDEFGNRNRLYGDPIDLENDSQVGIRNAVGCLISEITINGDGSLIVDPDCTSFDADFSVDGLYLGSDETLTWLGDPPEMGGVDLPALVFQLDLPIVDLNLSNFFVAGSAAITDYDMHALAAAVDSTTDVNGAVTASTTLVVDDASVLLDHFDGWISCGSGTPVQILGEAVNPLTNTITLRSPITCADNAQVNTHATAETSITGLTLDDATGVLSGTPTNAGTTGSIIFRATDSSGLYADSR